MIKQFLGTHVFYIILIVVGGFGVRTWIQEHDSRVLADERVRQAETTVKDLETRIQMTQKSSEVAIQRITMAVKTATSQAQAVALVPQLTDVPLNARPVVDNPTAVAVDWRPLITELGECKTDRVRLDACQSNLKDETAIVAQKDVEVTALKKKKGFWKSLGHDLKTAAIGGLIFEGIHIALSGGRR